MEERISRRRFIAQSAAAGVGLWLAQGEGKAMAKSPNEKLNIGVIGVANRGGDNLNGVKGENIVALCDIDDNYLGAVAKQFPDARIYNDYRRLLEQKDIDAVVVSTPDHTHAIITLAAMESGRDVYCEKPLTHTLYEARKVIETANRLKRVTQMGTQIHAGSNYRRVVELVQSGAIGPVREVHVWCDKVWSAEGLQVSTPPVPPNIHWDLWLGPARERAYSPAYMPGVWRGWWDFGGGTMADMACHHMDLPFWALKLRYPLTVEAEGPQIDSERAPKWQIVRYAFPERGELPAVNLTWYDGGKRPPQFASGDMPQWGDGTLFVGEKGMLLADYNQHRLLPEKQYEGFTPPKPWIPDSIGHHEEWIQACKKGGPTTCNFDYSGTLTEAVHLGNAALRVGKKLEWDPKKFRVTNCPEVDQYLSRVYRKGWEI